MSLLYPIYLDLQDRKVLVIGGGNVAFRKVERLLECGGRVTLISPDVVEPLDDLAAQGRIALLPRPYQSGDLEGTWLVIAACDVNEVNQQVFDEANRLRIFCNVVDDPPLCSFQVPAVVKRNLLQIAISTGGASPALARNIRIQLEDIFGEYYDDFLEFLHQLREHLKQKYPESQPRRAEILSEFVDSNALAYLQQGEEAKFQQLWQQYLNK